MARSFGLVEDKLQETEFFLERIRESNRISFAAKCYFSAFVSAARSVTLAMQASLTGVLHFDEWYAQAQSQLKTDPLAPFFVEIRNDAVHTGANPLNKVPFDHLREDLARQRSGGKRAHVIVLPDPQLKERTVLVDAVDACEKYFATLVSIVYECYCEFKMVVDSRWYHTEDNFVRMGKSFEDALVDLGFPRTWFDGVLLGPEAWRVIRLQQPPCLLNDLFERILGKTIAGPDED